MQSTKVPRRQIRWLIGLVLVYVAAAIVYVALPGMMDAVGALPSAAMPDIPRWQLALGNAGFILLLYLPAGILGVWLARKAGLPGIYRADADLRARFGRPLVIGVAAGLVLVVVDVATQRATDFGGFPHPPFPASLLASLTAGIGEEILFRLFLMSLWVVLLRWLLRRFLPTRRTARASLWGANVIAALAFAAGHLGTAMVIAGVETPAALPPVMLMEIIVLNGIVGLLAGASFARNGLVAAAGVHFWADVVWHVVYGLL